jgi:alkylation response protein AidB-like acyl-CoA dehydrogenase
MGKAGFAGMLAPVEYGGAGFNYVTFSLILEELSKASGGIAGCLVPHIGQQRAIGRFGTERQKSEFIPPLAKGEKLGAFSLTEPEAGSDAASLRTTASLNGDVYVINGTKSFVTNGADAEQFLLIARTDPETRNASGMSAFIVDKGTPGFDIEKKERKMGFRANSTTQLILKDCQIPSERRLGEEGDGFKVAMNLLDYAKLTAAVCALGIAQAAFDASRDYAKGRIQFGKPISQFQAIQFMLADMAVQIGAARSLSYGLANLMDRDLSNPTNAAAVKVFATDMAMSVTTDAVQIFGGYGYMRDYPVERYMRDAKLGQIYDGTNQIQRVIISRNILRE